MDYKELIEQLRDENNCNVLDYIGDAATAIETMLKATSMGKPTNPHPKGTLIWSVMEGDWADLDAAQIAEVLGTSSNIVHAMISRIKRETGYFVPHIRRKAGRKADE